jgi:hypothetical protein
MPATQFAAQAYQARSTQLLAQQCINAFVETSPKDAKTQVPIFGTPGLSIFSRCGRGPINGLWIMGDLLYALSGGALYSITSAGVATLIGQTNLGGVCVLADNGQQLVMVDGDGGWIYQPGGLNQISTATVPLLNEATITVGGTITNLDTLTVTASSPAITGSPQSVNVTVTGADTTTTLATKISNAINASPIATPGVVATHATNVVTMTWPTNVGISWTVGVAGSTETLTLSPTTVIGGTVIPAVISGTITSGDVLNITLDSGAIFSTTAAQTVSAELNTAIVITDPLPSALTAGATIVDPSASLAQIVNLAFMPPCYVCYMDGYFVFAATGTRQFFLSAINDGTQYSGLDFATATANTGFVLAVLNFHEQLLIFTSKASTEVWYDSGASAFPFQRYDGVYLQRGLSNSLALCSEDNTCFWMADDGIFYRNNGFLPERISTFAMEYAWARYPNKYFDCNAFVLDQEGHKFIVVNFLSGQATWCFDLSTKLWHQRESFGSPWV